MLENSLGMPNRKNPGTQGHPDRIPKWRDSGGQVGASDMLTCSYTRLALRFRRREGLKRQEMWTADFKRVPQ